MIKVYSCFNKGCFAHWELSTRKLLFGGHSGKSLPCSLYLNAQFPMPIAIFIETAIIIVISLKEQVKEHISVAQLLGGPPSQKSSGHSKSCPVCCSNAKSLQVKLLLTILGFLLLFGQIHLVR